MTKLPTRNRDLTSAKIIEAVGRVLARDGIDKIGINAIAREAGVDKVLIYRYFEGLPKLLTAWAASGEFWPSVQELVDISPPNLMELPLAERYVFFFDHFIDSLRARPLTIEILAGEISHRNALTDIMEDQREKWGEEVGRTLAALSEYQAHPALLPLTNVLIAGVQNLLIRARSIHSFGGLDIQSDEGWNLVKKSIGVMANKLFKP
ncbi:MAG TPA: TetR/AcrR family transcriptional regulator [Rhodoferax sp.]|nr:TetR/AcrR family transcriptional regulator [Rhodoferax sp.]